VFGLAHDPAVDAEPVADMSFHGFLLVTLTCGANRCGSTTQHAQSS
jgi:hypothetical protein